METSSQNSTILIYRVSIFIGILICFPKIINFLTDFFVGFRKKFIIFSKMPIIFSVALLNLLLLSFSFVDYLRDAAIIITFSQLLLVLYTTYLCVFRKEINSLKSSTSIFIISFIPMALFLNFWSVISPGKSNLILQLFSILLMIISLIYVYCSCRRKLQQDQDDIFAYFDFILFLFLVSGIIFFIIIQLVVTDVRLFFTVLAYIENVFVCGIIVNQDRYVQHLAYSTQVI